MQRHPKRVCFMFRHICSSHPCQKSLTAPGMLRTTGGQPVSRESHPSEERSEPPQKLGTGVSLYPTSPSSQSAAPHGCSVSLLIARSRMGGHGGRRQVASREEERSAALTIQLSRNREGGCYLPLHFTTDIFLLIGGVCSKNFFEFFPHGCNSLNNRLVVNPFLPCILTNTYSTEHDNIKYFKLNGTK